MADPLHARFVVVIGKGGVGKTTVSACLALRAARAGKRVLVAMCNVRERLSYALEVEPIGASNQTVLPGIEAVNMTPDKALEEYGLMVLKLRSLYKLIFENRLVTGFLRATPGLDAWAMLGKAQYHVAETDHTGRRRYDTVILDAPATGHGVDMLRVPRVILEVASPGLLRTEAERAWALLSDPKQAALCLVTLPEDMPTNEALELDQRVRTDLGLGTSCVVINRVLPPLFSPEQRDFVLGAMSSLDADSPLAGIARASRTRARWELLQQRCIAQLSAIPAPRIELPNLFVPEVRRPALMRLAELFDPPAPGPADAAAPGSMAC
ncbi:MAG: anion-transporting ATPase [Proteobacteria bacterium]|nr:anion-transporting ATPase [Pseudomonadota bacterium]